jgi:hypothetical protein
MDYANKKVITKYERLQIKAQCALKVHKPIFTRELETPWFILNTWDKSMGCGIVSKHNRLHLGKG